MAIEQLKVREIVKQAVGKSLDVPEFQRDFVWDADQVRRLAESLHRDYPVGSFLLWDSSQYQQSKQSLGTESSLWIVDGQQRTTALCLIFGMKPYWWPDAEKWNAALRKYDILVNVLPDRDDGRLEFALSNPIRSKDPRWVSLRDVLSKRSVAELTQLASEVAKRATTDPEERMTLLAHVNGHLNQLWQLGERLIPVVKISHEVEDVAEIFARVNQAGTRVKEADVVLALAAVHNPGWVREEYGPVRSDLEERGWDLDAGVFIRTMTGIGYGRARLRDVPSNFWQPDNLAGAWDAARDTVADVLKWFAGYGVLCSDLLPSTNALIPLFVLHRRWKTAPGYSFGKALRWFLLASRDGRYSGSAITALDEDVRAINEASAFDAALDALLRRLRVSHTLDAEEFLSRYDRAGNRFLRLMLYLVLYQRGAKDWVDGTALGYDKTGSPITTGYEPQWHHIYPRNLLRKCGVGEDEIQALANITVLNERTNANRVSGKEPWRYIHQLRVPPHALREHLIPESFILPADDPEPLKQQWDTTHYLTFVVDRAELLAREANAFLHRLETT